MPLASLTTGKKRFIYWDEYSPVEFASVPERRPTIPAQVFKKLFAGQTLEIQVSQAFNKENPEMKWTKGAALTAPLQNLWTPTRSCPPEAVRHMQSRVQQFDALVPLASELKDLPLCPETWASWLVSKATSFASKRAAQICAQKPIDDEDL